MTEATETTFFQGFFGKEMSENLMVFFFAELYVIGNGCMYLPRQSNSAGSLTSGLVVEWGSRVTMLPAAGILVGV